MIINLTRWQKETLVIANVLSLSDVLSYKAEEGVLKAVAKDICEDQNESLSGKSDTTGNCHWHTEGVWKP